MTSVYQQTHPELFDLRVQLAGLSPASTHLASYINTPIQCQSCGYTFKSYEKAWHFHREQLPRCLTCTPIFTPQTRRGWFMVVIIVVKPTPVYRTGAGLSQIDLPGAALNEIPRICSMCGLLTQAMGNCGQCRRQVCSICMDIRLHRCSLFCPFRACSTCSPLHECPNIVLPE